MIGMLLTLFVFTMFLTSFYKDIKHFYALKTRFQAYKCFKYHLKTNSSYLKKMESINQAITITYPLTLVPPTAPKAKAAIKTMQIIQIIIHASYLKNMTLNKYCTHLQRGMSLIKPPYGYLLKRDVIGRSKLKRFKWNIFVTTTPNAPIEVPMFLLQGSFHVSQKNRTNIKIKTQEKLTGVIAL